MLLLVFLGVVVVFDGMVVVVVVGIIVVVGVIVVVGDIVERIHEFSLPNPTAPHPAVPHQTNTSGTIHGGPKPKNCKNRF